MPVGSGAEFRPFSLTHAAVVAVFVAAVLIIVWLGRRWRGQTAERALGRVLATTTLLAWMLINAWWMLPPNFDAAKSLPIHVSDLNLLMAGVVLILRARWLRAMVYYWGVALSTQAFITPDLRDGPAFIGFWMFWASHFLIVAIAIYEIAVRGFRPSWRDFGIAVGLSAIYFGAMLPINTALGSNYGYVGQPTPSHPTLIDHLGPWPWRVLVLMLLGIAAFALITLPWQITSRAVSRTTARVAQN